jgi:threonine/homoserine/homoserine lactone efflux protein
LTNYRLYFTAIFISFMGSLPVGTLNVSVTDLTINMGAGAALQFGLGAMLVEVALVRIALVTVRRLAGLKQLFHFFRVFACAIVLVLAVFSLYGAWHMQKQGVVVPFAHYTPFVSGVFLSLINPLHLPFWMGWTAALRSKGVLSDTKEDFNVFVTAIGSGTALAFLLYGVAGHLLITFLRMQENLFNWLVGLALLMAGMVQLWKLLAVRAVPG